MSASAQRVQQAEPLTEVSANGLLDRHFTEIVDLWATQKRLRNRIKEDYNGDKQLSEANYTTATHFVFTTLLELVYNHMEYLRLNEPATYLYYLTTGDIFPVATCPQQIATMSNSLIRNKGTVRNHLNTLAHPSVGVILRKRHTSRAKVTITEDDGTTTTYKSFTGSQKNKDGQVIGRGDVIYYLPKSIFVFKSRIVTPLFSYVRNAENTSKTSFSQQIESQPVIYSKSEKSTQPNNDFYNYKNHLKNECGKHTDESGLASPDSIFHHPPTDGKIINGNKVRSIQPSAESQGVAPEKSGKIDKKDGNNSFRVAENGDASSRKQSGFNSAAAKASEKYQKSDTDQTIGNLLGTVAPEIAHNRGAKIVSPEVFAEKLEQAKADRYRLRVNYDLDIAKHIPQTDDLTRYAFAAWSQCREQLFSHLPQSTQNRIDRTCLTLMRMQIERVMKETGCELSIAYLLIIKALEKQRAAIDKKPEWELLFPTVYLDMTREYKFGLLKNVVDDWVIKDYFALVKSDKKLHSSRLKYNLAYNFTDKLYLQMVDDVTGKTGIGFTGILRRLTVGYYQKRIENYAKKQGLGQKSIDNLLTKFANSMTHLLRDLKRRKDTKNGFDPIYKEIEKLTAARKAAANKQRYGK